MITTHLIKIPHARGLTVYDGFENYHIFIDPDLSGSEQRRVFAHEMEHIKNGDFNMMCSASEIEEMRR